MRDGVIYIRTSDLCRELCLNGEVLEMLKLADIYDLIDQCLLIVKENGGTIYIGATAIHCDKEAAKELSLQCLCCL